MSMDDLRRLAADMKALDAELSKCMRCGFCQNFCPIYGETFREFDVSRGKIALIANMRDELLQDVAGLAERLNRCLLCGSCQANCPSATPAMNIFIRARAMVAAYMGLSPVKKLILRVLLPRPRLFDLILKVGAIGQGLVFRKVRDSAQGTVRAPLLSPLIGTRHIHALPGKPLHVTHPDLTIPAASGSPRVLFYPGCMADRMYTSVGAACIKALRYHGVGICFPSGLSCCGMPALASGDVQGFRRQVRRNLAVMQKHTFDFIVTPCGSCTAAIAEQWPAMGDFGEAESDLLRVLAKKNLDITAFLVDMCKVRPVESAPAAPTVTYHDPCHLKKTLKISRPPRDLVRAAGHPVVEMAESDRCCGCGGSFNLFHYDISQQIGQKKRDMIVATGAPVVATACPACIMQLNDVLSRNSDKVVVKHSIELYAASLSDGTWK